MFASAQRQIPSPLKGEEKIGLCPIHILGDFLHRGGTKFLRRVLVRTHMHCTVSIHRCVWLLAVSALLCTLISISIVHAEKLPYSLFGGTVTYTFPKRWSLQQVSRSKKLEALQFVIPLSDPGQAQRSANAILIAEPNAENLTVSDFLARKISKTYTPVADYSEGESWRTVLSQVPNSKPPYAVLDRFGVTAKVRVHLRIVLPAETDATAKWPSTLAKDSNEVIRKLGINLQNAVGVEIRYADGNWELLQSQTVTRNVLPRPSLPPPKPPAPTPLADQQLPPLAPQPNATTTPTP